MFGEMDMMHNTRGFLDEIACTKYIYGSLINKLLRIICSIVSNKVTGKDHPGGVCFVPTSF